MRHFVLTRSAYGPAWDPASNARRLALTRGVMVRTLAAQTNRDWNLVVLLDDDDPLRAERLAAFRGCGRPVIVIKWKSPVGGGVPVFTGTLDDGQGKRLLRAKFKSLDDRQAPHLLRRGIVEPPAARGAFTVRAAVAYRAYKVDWAGAIDASRGGVLMTRLDDDDGLAPTTLARVRAAAESLPGDARAVLMHPLGFRVWRGRYDRVRAPANAMHTLYTPDGDRLSVYDYGHTKVRSTKLRIINVDEETAWLWVRHMDTISGNRKGSRPLSRELKRIFPVDWSLLA